MTMPLVTCGGCGGLSPAASAACVHCDCRLVERRFGRVTRALGRLVLASGALVTLMACYGMTMRDRNAMRDCNDHDGDTVCMDQDCDNNKPEIFPGAADPDLDGIDQNCDGVDGWRDPAAVAADPVAPTPPPPTDPVPPPPPPAIATDPVPAPP